MPERNRWNTPLITPSSLAEAIGKTQREKVLENYDLKNFAKIFEDGDMMATCSCLLENDLNVAMTARKLYMHRNTLIYRLNKIRQITGLDLRNFYDAVTFSVLHGLYRAK